ncbi:MAG: mucin desulfatase [Planctomycetes bacterium RBG_16_43_13]|nr:MAG: mucin desulfatase [Planctomycetes bacterium RBG_16_43_13]
METINDICLIGQQFQIEGKLILAEPYGDGHINDTYRVVYNDSGKFCQYIYQRMNHTVFNEPSSVMANIERVTGHIQRKLTDSGERDIDRNVLTLVPTHSGLSYYKDANGRFWRSYMFIERAKTVSVVQTPKQAYEVAKAFGQFQSLLNDLPGPRLKETIPDFHNTPKRFQDFEGAFRKDVCNRAKFASREVDFVFQHKDMVDVIVNMYQQGGIPERITHNDTKINNVMLDEVTEEGLCVIDLDTVMPGLSLYDFGDMVRTATSPTAEDERDLSRIYVCMPIFQALAEGYLTSSSVLLTDVEKEYLVFAGKLITFEIGLRFLTDYLSGDTYFKIHRKEQNLDRCRAQFKLVESIIYYEEQMRRWIRGLL